jgi:DedD protein
VNDEGFREIQLNGKQLVFLFMAATVVSVVIFLCGVLVGRGVRGTGSSVEMASMDVGPDPGVTSAPDSGAQAAAGPSSPGVSAGAGDAAQPPEELSYAERLLREAPAEETLKYAPASPPGPPPAPAPAVQEPVAAQPAPSPSEPAPAVPRAAAPAPAPASAAPLTASDPTGPGFAVQVSIFETRQEADRLATQLVAKGYPAFVLDPMKGAAKPIYRVRVGKYRNRKDAEEMQARLEKAEQFTPWIAR